MVSNQRRQMKKRNGKERVVVAVGSIFLWIVRSKVRFVDTRELVGEWKRH